MNHQAQVQQVMHKIYDADVHEDVMQLSTVKREAFHFTPEEDSLLPHLVEENLIRHDEQQDTIRLTCFGINYIVLGKKQVNQHEPNMAASKTKAKAKKPAASAKPKSAAKTKKEKPDTVKIEHKGKTLEVIFKGESTDKRNGATYNRYQIPSTGRLIHQKIN